MTEEDWLDGGSWQRMLELLCEKGSDRKLRLFACACCRHIWPLLRDKRLRKAVIVSERHADGSATEQELRRAGTAAWQAACKNGEATERTPQTALAKWTWQAVSVATHYNQLLRNSILFAVDATFQASFWGGIEEPPFDPRRLLRCLFSNPFRSAGRSTSWLAWNDGVILQLAQAIYDERAFHRLPILADALEEAGCTHSDILNHCRQAAEHVRGCWIVDLILGKS